MSSALSNLASCPVNYYDMTKITSFDKRGFLCNSPGADLGEVRGGGSGQSNPPKLKI